MNSIPDNITLLNETPSIPHHFYRLSVESPDQEMAYAHLGNNNWKSYSRAEIAEQVLYFAHLLKSQGITAGDRVAILSGTRVEWLIADLAILSLGATSVSLYHSLLPDQIAYILTDSESKAVIAENSEQVHKLIEVFSKPWDIPSVEEQPARTISVASLPMFTFEEIDQKSLPVGRMQLTDSFNKEFDWGDGFPARALSRESIASLVYTSGTTGAPKGVIQTHANHLANVRQVLEAELMIPHSRIYLFLPLAHSFARLMGYLGILTSLSVAFPEVADKKSSKLNPQVLLRDMKAADAHIFPIVPRILEKIKDQLELQAKQSGLLSSIISATLSVSKKVVNEESKNPLHHLLYILLAPMRALIRRKLFGSNLEYCVSGGAKLSPSVHEFFHSIGILVLQGYGLTETCVATNVCTPKRFKIGSVGPALSKDIEIKILEDGEILFRGPNISQGYLNRPQATAESWDQDGWFHTGDLGLLDEDSFLKVTGRKKEIIVTSGGKNIAPLPIEEDICKANVISQAVMIGDGRKYCIAIITINKAALPKDTSYPLDDDETLRDLVSKHIESVNSELASYETIKKFIIADEEFSIENGMLTPSMKIKRKVVSDHYEAKIDSLFG